MRATDALAVNGSGESASGRSLWAEIGLNLALLAFAAMVLNAGVGWLVASSARDRAGEDLARRSVRVLAQQLAAHDAALAHPAGGAMERDPRAVEAWLPVLDAYAESGGTFDSPRVASRTSSRGGDGAGIHVWDASGAALYGRDLLPPRGRAANATREPVAWVDADVAWAVAPVGSRRDRLVGVRVALSTAAGPAWLLVTSHAVLSALLLGAFGLFLLQRRVVGPLQLLRDTTARIAAGAFGERVVTDAPAEVAALASSLDALSLALAEYRSRTGEQVAQLGSAFDDLRRAQDALVRTERLASVGQLAAGLAHELGNPLAAVRGYIEILRAESASAGPGSGDLVRRCAQEVERMHVLVRRVLDFARPQPVVSAACEVGALLTDARESLLALPGCGVVCVDVVPCDPVTVEVDRGRTHQVLLNVLRNAVDAGARTLRLETTVLADHVEVSVEDDGPGVPLELQARVFEPFFTTRPPGEGTGLGLAIAQRLAEEQGGALRLVSGTTSMSGARFLLRVRRPAAMLSRGVPERSGEPVAPGAARDAPVTY